MYCVHCIQYNVLEMDLSIIDKSVCPSCLGTFLYPIQGIEIMERNVQWLWESTASATVYL